MQRDGWARLAAPFPAAALDWWVAELALEGRSARLEPLVSEAAAAARLDEALGVAGWSQRLLPLGPDAVVCELELLAVRKSAVARSYGGIIDAQRVCAWAFGRAAARFGMRAPADRGAWVDFDPEAGVPLYLPEVVTGAAPPAEQAFGAQVTAEQAPGPAPAAAAGSAQSAGREAIERLLERLRAEGLGRQAAGLVVEHGGYGRTPDEARELYRRLRALLLENGAAS